MSEDPKLFDAGDYNLFRYCHNDPIDFTDPMGLDNAGQRRQARRSACGTGRSILIAQVEPMATGLLAFKAEQQIRHSYG